MSEDDSRLLVDVGALAIGLVADHPGNEYVADTLAPGFRGSETLLVYEYLPLRVQWLLTTEWEIDRVRARNAVRSLLDQPVTFVPAGREILVDAYDISADRNHDVYDCFYVALARATDASALVTTDRDFERLCTDEPFDYLNPVPESVLDSFVAYDG